MTLTIVKDPGMKTFWFVVAIVCALLNCATVQAQTFPPDKRYCGCPARDADGSIHRSPAVVSAFKRAHACPANGANKGACPGWSVDHVIPLICGGCDAVENAQWLPNGIKSCAGTQCKDRWEQRVYCQTRCDK